MALAEAAASRACQASLGPACGCGFRQQSLLPKATTTGQTTDWKLGHTDTCWQPIGRAALRALSLFLSLEAARHRHRQMVPLPAASAIHLLPNVCSCVTQLVPASTPLPGCLAGRPAKLMRRRASQPPHPRRVPARSNPSSQPEAALASQPLAPESWLAGWLAGQIWVVRGLRCVSARARPGKLTLGLPTTGAHGPNEPNQVSALGSKLASARSRSPLAAAAVAPGPCRGLPADQWLTGWLTKATFDATFPVYLC